MRMAEGNYPTSDEPGAWSAAGDEENIGLPLQYECSSIADFQQKLSQLVNFHSTALIPEFIQAEFFLGPHLMIEIEDPAKPQHNVPEGGAANPVTSPSTTSPKTQTKHKISIPIYASLNNQPLTHPDLQKAVGKSIFAMVSDIDGFCWSTRNLTRPRDGWRLQNTCADSRYNMSRIANQGRGKGKRGRVSVKNVDVGIGNGNGNGVGGAMEGVQDGGEQMAEGEGDPEGQAAGDGDGEGGEGEDGDQTPSSKPAKKGRGKYSNLPVFDCSGLVTCIFSSTHQVLIVKYSHCPVHRTVMDRKRVARARDGGRHRKKTDAGVVVVDLLGQRYHQQQHSTPDTVGYRERDLYLNDRAAENANANANGEADAEGELEDGIDPGMQLLREWNQSVQAERSGPQAQRS